jgi:acetyltransferase-like isoleucine patch superfamily enzyme
MEVRKKLRHYVATMDLHLTDEQAPLLVAELDQIIKNDRYFLSPRIGVLREIRAHDPRQRRAGPRAAGRLVPGNCQHPGRAAGYGAAAVDIHPAVPIGSGVFIDHGTGLVVGETAVIGDDVSILHEVTLGGTGKERGDRHPKVRDGVLLGAGAKVLGNVEIGRDAKVAAGSVVPHDVPPGATVAGVSARIVGWSSGSVPALEMDQSLPDYEI